MLISPSAYMLDWMRARGWTLPERHFVQQYARSDAVERRRRRRRRARATPTARRPSSSSSAGSSRARDCGCSATRSTSSLRARPRAGRPVTFLGKRVLGRRRRRRGVHLRERDGRWPWPVADHRRPRTAGGARLPALARPQADGDPLARRQLAEHGLRGARARDPVPRLAGRRHRGVDRPARPRAGHVRSRGRPSVLVDAGPPHSRAGSRRRCARGPSRPRAPRSPRTPVATRTCTGTPRFARRRPPAAPSRRRSRSRSRSWATADPDRADADAYLFISPGSGLTLGAIETLERAAAVCDAEVIAVAVTGDGRRKPVTRVPVGGPPIAGLLRRCFGDAGFMIRSDALERLGGLSEEVEPADRAHHLLSRAAIAGMRIEVLPEPLIVGPPDALAPMTIVEQSRRRRRDPRCLRRRASRAAGGPAAAHPAAATQPPSRPSVSWSTSTSTGSAASPCRSVARLAARAGCAAPCVDIGTAGRGNPHRPRAHQMASPQTTPTVPGPGLSVPETPPREISIDVERLSKSYMIPTKKLDTLKERAVRPFERATYRRLQALDEVSFDVEQGEFFGIVGRNGSGKSTLLKLLASIYRADAGRIRIAGRVVPFIELGVGFNVELSARDNVVLNGVMMGLTPREARRRFERGDRVRRARGVLGAEAEELLLGDDGAARVRAHDPGRRRRAADRRGAGGRRRGLPAEVLRRVQPSAPRGPHDRPRHPRHAHGPGPLRSRDPARGGADPRDRRRRRRRAALPGAQLRAPARREGVRGRPLSRRGRRGASSSTCGSSTSPGQR